MKAFQKAIWRSMVVLLSLLTALTTLWGVSPVMAATLTTTIPTGSTPPYAIAVDASTNTIYVANYWSQNVMVINGATNATT